PFPITASAMTADPLGSFLFAGDSASPVIHVASIDQVTGELTVVAGLPFFTTAMQFVPFLTTDGTGKFLYATEGLGGTNTNVFSVDPTTGFLTPFIGNPVITPASFVQPEPNGNFLVGINPKTGNGSIPSDRNLYVFSIDQSTGTISQIVGSPFQ